MTTQAITTHDVDIAIIGGGIAGLWVLNRLCNQGYNAILFEHTSLGSDQTVASQGMIHGGIKYTLAGTLTGASEAIADMPDHWRACMQGKGDVDLRKAQILSDHFYMWSTASLGSRLGGFFASKATRGRVEAIKQGNLPPLFQQPRFKGKLYKLADMVVDTASVVKVLADNVNNRIFTIDWHKAQLDKDNLNQVILTINQDDNLIEIKPRAIVLTAGKGNAQLLNACGADHPTMQCRPLQQVMVRHNNPHSFYGHCLGAETTPRLTISSHPLKDGSQVWYLGGSLAEKGATQTPKQVINCAKKELAELMPWVDFSQAQWATLPVDRAEPQQRNFARPDKAFADWASGPENVIAAWPTKLTLSPNLAEEVEKLLIKKHILPSAQASPQLPLPTPGISPMPWESAFGRPP